VRETETCEEVFGLVKDENGTHIKTTDYAGKAQPGSYEVSSNPDFSSLLKVGNKVFSVVQFEYPRPGVMYATELRKDRAGRLSPKRMESVDWSHEGGLWIPCAGSVSPWQTHIGGEEYEPDAKYYSPKFYPNDTSICGASRGVCTSIICEPDEIQLPVQNWKTCSELRDAYEFAKYFSSSPNGSLYPGEVKNITTLRSMFNPYRYGYTFEVKVNPDGSTEAKKWFAVGRRSTELAYILPDNKTMYLSDDGTNSMLNMFVADAPMDFSSGNLYAAKFKQHTDGSKGGEFTIDWIPLGHANETEIRDAAHKLRFSDIFDMAKPTVREEGVSCPEGFQSVNTGTAGLECLKVLPGMDTIASRLETRRYAALKGATTEFSKLEGLTFDSKSHRIFAAVSDLKDGMEDQKENGKYDAGGPNDIKIGYKMCGCVYALDLDESNMAVNMYPFLCGDTENNVDDKNRCNTNSVANPDNVAMMSDFETLLVAEDTKFHENNFLWAYHIPSGSLQRIFSAPYGAEVTSPYYYEIDGYGYILVVAQHPYEWNDYALSTSSSGKAGTVGYIGPIPLRQYNVKARDQSSGR